MTTGTWLVLIVVVVPLVTTLMWGLARESVVNVPAGDLGLLVVKGKSTDRSLLPGVHWVPALRKRQTVYYPSVELSYRASTDAPVSNRVEGSGPPLRVVLGDRAEAVVGYTVRFRLVPEKLRKVHDRFGTTGFWSAVRDTSEAALSTAFSEPETNLDTLHPTQRAALQERLRERVEAALDDEGIVLTGFTLGAVELGRTGETIQATVRARLELAREQAEAATQMLRARNDAKLAKVLDGIGDTGLRYRQVEVWRELAQRTDSSAVSIPSSARPDGQNPSAPPPTEAADQRLADQPGAPA